MKSISEYYDLDVDTIVQKIRDAKAKRVLIQLPDGLKMYADQLQSAITTQVDVELLFWAGSGFGSCDIPVQVERLDVDLLLHLGHAPWR